MARADFDTWIPEEDGSQILHRIEQTSAIERLARREPMNTDTKNVPRSLGMGVEVVAKGAPYGEDTTAVDEVTLSAIKFGKAVRIAEEDLDDSPLAILENRRMEWATSYAKLIDNASLGVTAAPNGTTIPFASVYYALSQANGTTGYSANANIVQVATATAVGYDDLSDVLSIYETSDYFSPTDALVIAHPAFRGKLRGIKDSQDRPIFVQGQGGDSGTPDTLFDFPVAWSLGARTNATASSSPSGNHLLVIVNRQFLIFGVRSGPESVFIDGRDGLSALTDEAILKMRARRGFVLGVEHAAAVLEDIP